MVTPGHLVLGWRMNRNGSPRFWIGKNPKPGHQSDNELVSIPAESMTTHTVIIAQSGSGKSFFLGRLIEELLLNTKARCLILDSNADFRMIHKVVPAQFWKKARYNVSEGSGWLPTERSKSEFQSWWRKLSIRILSGSPELGENKPYERLRLWWPNLSVEFLSEGFEPIQRSELYHCHRFVKAIGRLVSLRYAQSHRAHSVSKKGPIQSSTAPIDFITETEELFGKANQLADSELYKLLTTKFSPPRGSSILPSGRISAQATPKSAIDLNDILIRRFARQAIAARKYVSPATVRFYFSNAKEYFAAGIVASEPPPRAAAVDLVVIDLPSFLDKDSRFLAINATLTSEFDRSRTLWASSLKKPPDQDTRVPNFIIVDEAHTYLPLIARGKAAIALREQFRRIAAEGRKYGLFLILVSQRPDKLDPLIISECENKAIMHLDSSAVQRIVSEILGLENNSANLLEQSTRSGRGRALLVGHWAEEGPQALYCAARRTIEGGRNLLSEYWTTSRFAP